MPNHIPALTGLRFFAAFWVVGFHYFNFTEGFSFLFPIFNIEHLGVPFFFILSGFIIALNYTEREFTYKNFLVLRMARIAPMYYLALLLALPILYITFKQGESTFELGGKMFVNLAMLQTLFPLKSFTEGWNTPGWSISAELFFYLLFPFIKGLKLGPFKSSINNFIFLFIIACALELIKSILPDTIFFFGERRDFYFKGLIFFRMINFLIGMQLFYVFSDYYQKIKSIKNELLLIIFSLFLLCSICLLPTSFLTAENPIIIFIFSLFILINASSEKLNKFYDKKLWLFLGEASYSLYILQAPLKLYAQQFYSKVLGITPTKGPLFTLYLSITLIGISSLFYLFFETPTRKFIRNRFYKKYI